MKLQSLKILLSLILSTSSIKLQAAETTTPNDKVCYTKPEVDKIVRYTHDFDLCKLNYQTMTEQYNKSLELSKPQDPLIGDGLVFGASIFAGVVLGFMAGMKGK